MASYAVDDLTVLKIELAEEDGFQPAGADHIVGDVRAAAASAIAGARALLDEMQALAVSEATLTFGIKVTGTAQWLVAKAATEGSFQVSLSWKASDPA